MLNFEKHYPKLRYVKIEYWTKYQSQPNKTDQIGGKEWIGTISGHWMWYYSLRIINVDRVRHLVEDRFERSVSQYRPESSRLLPVSGVIGRKIPNREEDRRRSSRGCRDQRQSPRYEFRPPCRIDSRGHVLRSLAFISIDKGFILSMRALSLLPPRGLAAKHFRRGEVGGSMAMESALDFWSVDAALGLADRGTSCKRCSRWSSLIEMEGDHLEICRSIFEEPDRLDRRLDRVTRDSLKSILRDLEDGRE